MNTIKRYREIIVYLFFGALTVLLNCVLYVLFNHFWGYEFANGIGNALANFICILFAYVTNRTAVFCSKSSGISAIREIVCFIVGRLGTLVLDTGIMIFAGIYIGAHYIPNEYQNLWGMEYILIGDYYLPALKVPRTRPVGRWGMLHKAYLKLRKPAYYQSLLLNGKLDAVLADVEEQAAERYEVLIEQMSQRESISEKLKEENQMEWVSRMRNLENRAEEIVKAELIYTFERR